MRNEAGRYCLMSAVAQFRNLREYCSSERHANCLTRNSYHFLVQTFRFSGTATLKKLQKDSAFITLNSITVYNFLNRSANYYSFIYCFFFL